MSELPGRSRIHPYKIATWKPGVSASEPCMFQMVGDSGAWVSKSDHEELLATHNAKARNDALEEAEKAAQTEMLGPGCCDTTTRCIMSAIRALKTPDEPTSGGV